MEITIMASLFTKWNVDVDTGHSFSFQWAVPVFSRQYQFSIYSS